MNTRWLAAPLLLAWGGACTPSSCPPCEVQTPSAPCAAEPRPSAPVTRTGPTDSRETRTQAVIAGVVARNRQKVRDCYEAARAKNPNLAGTLTVHFELSAAGDVLEAHVVRERSTLLDPQLHACATAAIRTIRFPRSSRGFESRVNYPFDFKP